MITVKKFNLATTDFAIINIERSPATSEIFIHSRFSVDTAFVRIWFIFWFTSKNFTAEAPIR